MDTHVEKYTEQKDEILSHVRIEKESHKLFSIDEPEFDTSTYYGRFRRNRLICNLFLAFHTNSQIVDMQNMIEAQK